MPDVGTIAVAEMEERVAVAKLALQSCGPTSGQQFTTAFTSYQSAVNDAIAGRRAAVLREAQSAVDTCAATPAQSSPPATTHQ
jgi:hypothetical protein